MNSNRRIAVVAGVAFLIGTIAQIVGVALVSPILGAPDYLAEISANEDRVLFGALFQFIGGRCLYRHCPGAVPGVEDAQPRSGHGIGRLSDHRGRVPWPHRRLLAVAGDLEPGGCERWSSGFVRLPGPGCAIAGRT